MDDDDRHHFQSLLYLCNNEASITIRDFIQGGYTREEFFDVEIDKQLLAIGAYCLMDNHFHLLVRELDDNGISHFMLKFTTAYTMYFNKKYKRVGPLFQGAFKAEHANDDRYLEYLYAYIHLNPLKKLDKDWKSAVEHSPSLVQNIFSYPYSSFLDYSNSGSLRMESKILNKGEFPEYFENRESFLKYHLEWLNYDRGLTSVEKRFM
jgi:putative transposase